MYVQAMLDCCYGFAVFTQGERGIQVTGVFLVFAAGLHLIEAVRNSAQKKRSNGKQQSTPPSPA